MVGCYGVGNVLHEDCLTCLGLCHDKRALSLAYGREEVDDACAEIGCGTVAAEVEVLVGEERCEVFECHTVAYFVGVASVDHVDACKREVFLAVVRRTHVAVYYVASLESVALHLLCRHVYIVGRREVVVVA